MKRIVELDIIKALAINNGGYWSYGLSYYYRSNVLFNTCSAFLWFQAIHAKTILNSVLNHH